jgi:hypothetical protein
MTGEERISDFRFAISADMTLVLVEQQLCHATDSVQDRIRTTGGDGRG